MGERDLLNKQLEELSQDLQSTTTSLDICQKTIVLLQKASEYARQQMKNTIESIVTNALNVVFANDTKFEIELGTRGGNPTAEFYVVTPEGLKCNPIDAKGGGLVDIISMGLRLAVLELYQPKIGGPIILDEPGKMVSAEYAEGMAYFLKEYGNRVGRQIIVITHNGVLAAVGDKSFNVNIKNGISEVKEI